MRPSNKRWGNGFRGPRLAPLQGVRLLTAYLWHAAWVRYWERMARHPRGPTGQWVYHLQRMLEISEEIDDV